MILSAICVFFIRDGCKQLAVFSALFLGMLGLFFAALRLDASAFGFKLLLGVVAEAFLFYLIMRQIRNLTMLCETLKNMDHVVKDTLVNAEYKERYGQITIDERYNLHFSQYGKYIIPEENYHWSSVFSMSGKEVYTCANRSDEYYLVLSKPHTGKILLAYNTKMFEME